MGKRLEDYRPDVTHQTLMALLDSPLNKAGKLQVFIRTHKKALIEVSPFIRIPRTYKRFQGLFAQLLTKLKVKAEGHEGSGTLLKVVKSSFEKVLPTNVLKIGTSCNARLVDLDEFIEAEEEKRPEQPICFIVGAVSTGDPALEIEGIDDCVCISGFPLSAACVGAKLTTAYEQLWGVH